MRSSSFTRLFNPSFSHSLRIAIVDGTTTLRCVTHVGMSLSVLRLKLALQNTYQARLFYYYFLKKTYLQLFFS